MSLGIIELLTRIGEDHVRVQNIEQGDVSVQATKRGTRVTFYTDPSFISPASVLNDTSPMVGLVVWMGFRGWRRVWWSPEAERPFPDWKTP